MRPVLAVAYAVGIVALAAACTSLKTDKGSPGAPTDDGGATEDAAPTSDAGEVDAHVPDAPGPPETYAEAQARLQALREAGPRTAQGSRVSCTDSHVAWRDMDGTIHMWGGASRERKDYTFKAPRAPFTPSDELVPVDATDYSSLRIHIRDTGTFRADSPYATHFWGTNTGVVRFDQNIGGVDQGGTRVRFWSNGTIDDVVPTLDTRQPPSTLGLGKVVLPGSTTIPFPLYVVDLASKQTSSVTFDAAIGLRQVAVSEEGLLVSYARTGPKSALRLYRGFRDAGREEIGDEIASKPGLFPDSPALEHELLSNVAPFEQWVLHDSAFGIFAYHLRRGTLVAVQLGANKTVFAPDALCVMPKLDLLAYRINGDATGQVWVVPLDKILPP